MSPFSDTVSLDPDMSAAHPFMRRRLADALMLHLSDGLMLLLAVYIGDLILHWAHGVPVQVQRMLLLLPTWWVGTWLTRLVPGWGLGAVEELRRIQLLLATIFAGATVLLFLGVKEGGASRISFFMSYAAAAVLVPLGRVIAKSALTALNGWGVPTVIYGTRETIPLISATLRQDRALGYIPKGALSDEYSLGEMAGDLPVIGGLRNTTRRMPVAVVSLPDLPRKKLISLMEGPLQTYHTVLLVPDLKDAPSLWVKPCDLQGILALEIQCNLLNPLALFAKNLAERTLVILTLPLWGPICLLFVLLVWLQDLHPAIYAQERIGKNNQIFKAYKLRTMMPDAERVLNRRLAEDPALKAEWEENFKLKKDPRITPVGWFLRKTSLDELPQLWCVLTGRMALVGPRPLPQYHHDELHPRTQRLRAQVRPGITGLWQVSGRSDSGTAGMDRWDTYYVRNWSVWLDLVILARTARVVLLGSGAY